MTTKIFAIEEVKNFLKIDSNDDDELLNGIAIAAIEYFEEYTGNLLMHKDIEEKIEVYDGICYTRFHPIVEIKSIHLIYSDRETSKLALPKYMYRTRNDRSVEMANFDGNISIKYVAGIKKNADDIPKNIRMSLLEMIGYLYDHRGHNIDGIGKFLRKFDYYRPLRI